MIIPDIEAINLACVRWNHVNLTGMPSSASSSDRMLAAMVKGLIYRYNRVNGLVVYMYSI